MGIQCMLFSRIRRWPLGCAVAVTLLLAAAHATAGTNGVTADEMISALSAEGLAMVLDTNADDDPVISSSIGNTEFDIDFFGGAVDLFQVAAHCVSNASAPRPLQR